MSDYADPFGAPEHFCTGAIFELAAPGIVRVLMVSREDGQQIVKTKLLMPICAMPACIAGASAFAASHILALAAGERVAVPLLRVMQ